jgi:hypothetical protein
MSDLSRWIPENAVLALWSLIALGVILYELFVRAKELVFPSPLAPPEHWIGAEVVGRPALNGIGYLFIGVACIVTGLDLISLHQEILGLLALVVMFAAAMVVLIKAWADFSGPRFTVDDRGIHCAVYGTIPWSEVEAVRMSTGVHVDRGQSYLFVRVPDIRSYRVKLTPMQYFTYGSFLARSVVLKNEIVFDLNGLNRKPAYILAAVERLRQRALHQTEKSLHGEPARASLELPVGRSADSDEKNTGRDVDQETNLTAIVKYVGGFFANKKDRQRFFLIAVVIVVYIFYFIQSILYQRS